MPKIYIRWSVILILSVLVRAVSLAQPASQVEHYSTEDGLSHNRIMCMLKDKEGFMWFGTWDGLNRFDGHNFVTYKSRAGDQSSLRSSRIQEIVEDKSGNLWLKAYDNRIYRFNKKTEQFFFVRPKDVNAAHHYPQYDKIILSKTGQIWITTINNGLYWFPQPNAKTLTPVLFAESAGRTHGLPSNTINFFYEDSEGSFWVGTTKGLTVLKKDRNDKFESVSLKQNHIQNVNFKSISEDVQYIWLGTATGELIRIRKSDHVFTYTHVSNSALKAIICSRNNRSIYAITGTAQVIIADTTATQACAYEMPSAGSFYSVHEDKQGLLWLCPEREGAVKFDPVTKIFKSFSQHPDTYSDPHLRYFKVFEDKYDLLWISMRNGGFGYYDKQKDEIEYFYDKPGSADYRFSNVIVCSYYDPSGILWINAEDKGLNKIVFLSNNFTKKFLVKNSLLRSDNEIRGMAYDAQGRLWLANKSCQVYVSQKDQLHLVTFVNAPKEGIGAIYSIVQDTSGAMWLGTKNNGLFKATAVNNGATVFKLEHFTTNSADKYSISGNSVYTLMKDQQGRIWAGTYDNGINLIKNQDGSTLFLNSRNLFADWPVDDYRKVRHMQQDAQGRIWVATTDGLVILVINKGNLGHKLATYSKEPGNRSSLSKNDIQFIYRDSKNEMWLATSGGGLNRAMGQDPLNKLTFQAFTTENGLNSDYILSCIEDNDHNLWIATENGLSRFSPATAQIQNYDSFDGLPKSGFAEAASLKLPSGTLVFGGLNGYVSFNPTGITSHKIPANIAFTNLQINNTDISANDNSHVLKVNINQTPELNLKWNQNIVSIDYSVLDYRLSKKQTYAFRLLGFDTLWRNNKTQRRATYTNLHPGTYKFEVVASNANLYNNKPYKSIIINIARPPWLTWWAYLIYVIVASAILEAIRRTLITVVQLKHRVALEKHIAEMKTSFFTNVSHELRTPLTLILNPIEQLREDHTLSVQHKGYIEMVSRNARRMERFINQLLDLRKAESGTALLRVSQTDIISLLKEIAGYFMEVAADKNIKIDFDFSPQELTVWLDIEKFDVVIYNLLANAIKFTPRDKVIRISVGFNTEENSYVIQIADQGPGVTEQHLKDIFKLYYTAENNIETNLSGTGIGLALAKELIELHSGNINAYNNDDGGLTVTLYLPVGKDYLTGRKFIFADEIPTLPKSFETSMQELLSQSNVQHYTPAPEGLPLLLIVEDNKDMRDFLKDQLSEIFRVEVAENGRQGIDQAIKLLPDIILSDIMMPEVNGIQLLEKLKNDKITSHIPIILLTARFAVEHQIEGLKYGADYYISKPFDKALLITAIKNVLVQRKRIFETIAANKKTIVLEPADIQITSADESFLKKVIDVVNAQIENADFNIDDLAESLNIGRSTFNKKIKSLTGLTPVELVRDLRLKRGRQYLDKGEHHIAEIAYLTGFGSSKYFSTCFKEQYGISPSEYLRQKENNNK